MIRVVVMDDEELVRTGFRLLLQAAGDIEVVATASGCPQYWPGRQESGLVQRARMLTVAAGLLLGARVSARSERLLIRRVRR